MVTSMVPMIPSTVAVSDKQSQASTLLSCAPYQPPRSSKSQTAQVGHIQVPQMVQLPEGLLQRLLASSSCVYAVWMPVITLNSRCCCLLERRPSTHRAAKASADVIPSEELQAWRGGQGYIPNLLQLVPSKQESV